MISRKYEYQKHCWKPSRFWPGPVPGLVLTRVQATSKARVFELVKQTTLKKVVLETVISL
jgi:hypothetical protein